VVARGRGLEACIASVAAWRPEFALTIRGPGGPEYLEHLAALAVEHGVAGRVTFAAPVPMTELVRAAAPFDVGLFALPGHSRQNRHALPNKLFEYLMAGLALCISDLPEMAAILRHWRAGELIPAVTPEAIAAAVNRLTRPAIDACKRNALAAARELNWEREGQRFLEACQGIVGGAPPP
jgi:glycosyltransferase involved in cell wall biosynthesis